MHARSAASSSPPLAAAGLAAAPAFAQPKVDFILNWVPGGDHAPYYYAKKMGWYKDAGIDLNLEPGKGSAVAVQKVGAGANPIGLADMPNALTLRGKGADTVGVFNVYANSPQGLYWLKSSGIKSVKDLAGKKIGNPAGDGARTIWPALAKANGIDPNSVTWVNIDANAKLAALKSKSIDATTSFYNIHHIFQRELGDDMGFVAWKDAGLNTYGNTIIVNGDYLKKNKATVAAFVKVTQKAFAACVATPAPCVQALIDANGALQLDNETDQLAAGRGADERQVLRRRRARHPRRRAHGRRLRASSRPTSASTSRSTSRSPTPTSSSTARSRCRSDGATP